MPLFCSLPSDLVPEGSPDRPQLLALLKSSSAASKKRKAAAADSNNSRLKAATAFGPPLVQAFTVSSPPHILLPKLTMFYMCKHMDKAAQLLLPSPRLRLESHGSFSQLVSYIMYDCTTSGQQVFKEPNGLVTKTVFSVHSTRTIICHVHNCFSKTFASQQGSRCVPISTVVFKPSGNPDHASVHCRLVSIQQYTYAGLDSDCQVLRTNLKKLNMRMGEFVGAGPNQGAAAE